MKRKLLLFFCFLSTIVFSQPIEKPNVILILTDDQGVGDLSCHGNPWLKTPNLDAFYRKSVRMTDFHVSPLCTPTRAAIMTGQYPINNGAWATFKGRDALSEGVTTIADVFKQNGYKTGLFGKWHLGDNYPTRPTDCGFDEAIHHLAGGVGELSDYWGNSYFNDVYYVNNEPKQFEGYCTDVWFNETMKFIDKNKEEPFFVYLPTNAPHDPLIVDEKYAAPYKHLEGDKIIDANLYGMIANIDENFGRFYKFLKKKELLDNTILIYMSDNGTRFGYSPDGKLGYNKGFEGIKGSKLEGGHVVPFFIRWPNGNIKGGKDINDLVAHVDLLPTLAAMCNLDMPEEKQLDGIDFSPVLNNINTKIPERSVFVHHRQDWRQPEPVWGTCIMKNQWRLINGKQLYDIVDDPKQKHDLSSEYPELVKELLLENSKFIAATKKNKVYHELPMQVVGNAAQNEIKLTIQHAIGEGGGIWKPEQVSAGMKNPNNTHALRIESTGTYLISCMRWPKECSGPILGVPKENPKDLYDYKRISPNKVRISIANQMIEKEIQPNQEAVTFEVNLQEGKTLLITDFIEGKKKYGVYYTYVKYLGTN
ncbi:arylsulfatase [Seonamhaeicola marinus]|uniref:Arylsulfatase n=1 Tax=Seonamhaeicola marinus TaxID=1912246 RepID=A0A5D0HTL5_9FLAO|nr:arylsulfatase [Seonamhaeicola marinus]TYA74655.1 arylsulfatase [Seonamhaeicola marinus]